MNRFITSLSGNLPEADVHGIRQFTEGEGRIYNRISGLLTFTVVLVLVLTSLCVMAGMSNVAIERKNDVGLMKAIGGSVRRVVNLFLAEAILMGIAAGIVGSLVRHLDFDFVWAKRYSAWLRNLAGLCILFPWPSPSSFPLPVRIRFADWRVFARPACFEVRSDHAGQNRFAGQGIRFAARAQWHFLRCGSRENGSRLMGPSGSGKTTLINILGGLDTVTSGHVVVDGVDLAKLSESELVRYRAEKIGFVFQQFHLVPYLNALENVMLAQYFHSVTDEAQATEALKKVGLGDRLTHLPAHLVRRRTATRGDRAGADQSTEIDFGG